MPAQAPGDHQVDHDEAAAVELEDDLLGESPHAGDGPTPYILDRGRHGAKHEGTRQPDVVQHLAGDTPIQVLDVDGEVRQLRHAAAFRDSGLRNPTPHCTGVSQRSRSGLKAPGGGCANPAAPLPRDKAAASNPTEPARGPRFSPVQGCERKSVRNGAGTHSRSAIGTS